MGFTTVLSTAELKLSNVGRLPLNKFTELAPGDCTLSLGLDVGPTSEGGTVATSGADNVVEGLPTFPRWFECKDRVLEVRVSAPPPAAPAAVVVRDCCDFDCDFDRDFDDDDDELVGSPVELDFDFDFDFVDVDVDGDLLLDDVTALELLLCCDDPDWSCEGKDASVGGAVWFSRIIFATPLRSDLST
jgi:hypothetical protein